MTVFTYNDSAVLTTETGLSSTGGTTLTLAAATSWPAANATAVIEPGTSNAEEIYYTTLNTGTGAMSGITRGYNGTTARTHASGSAIVHELVGKAVQEASDHINNVDPSSAHGRRLRVEAYIPANLTPAATTLTGLRLVVDAARSMSGWTISGTNPNDISLVPPGGLTGLWVAKCGMSWSTSAASSSTSERSIQVIGVNGSNWTRFAPAHNAGHVINFEQNLYAESVAFDITAFTSYQLQFYSNTAGNTVSQNQSTGPGAVWNVAEHATWMALEKL